MLPLPLRLDPAEPFAHWLQRLAVLLEEHVGAQEYWPLAESQQAAAMADQRGLLQAFLADWMAVLYRQRTARELRWQLDVDPLDV